MAAANSPHGHSVRGRLRTTPTAIAPAASIPRALHGYTMAAGMAMTASMRPTIPAQKPAMTRRADTVLLQRR